MKKRRTVCSGKVRSAAVAALMGALIGPGAPQVWAADAPQPPTSIPLAAVAMPIVADGRLINYVFVTIKLQLSTGADGAVVRAKEPFFRDALVRAAHRKPFSLTSDYTHVDVPRIRAEVMQDAVAILGRGVVTNVTVTKQVSQHIVPPPSAAAIHAEPELIP